MRRDVNIFISELFPFSRLIAKSAISVQMSNAFIIFSLLQIKGY